MTKAPNKSPDTIFALSSPQGKSALAVIRISGPQAFKALQCLGFKEEKKSNHVYRVHLYAYSNPKECLDDTFVVYFDSDFSFTGYDLVELQLHGSTGIIQSVLSELHKIPFVRLAEPGEFTRQALFNERMDLVQVEALGDLIDSETRAQGNIAVRQFSGQLKSLYEKWRQELIEIMAQMEAYIDFPEDDIPHSAVESAFIKINALKEEVKKYLKRSEMASSLLKGINIAIIGEPNTGKSTILNLLSQQNTAIVSDIAGTTRDVLQHKIELGTLPVILNDTAGIRETSDPIEKEGVKRAKQAAENATITLLVFDIQNDPANNPSIEFLTKITKQNPQTKHICIINKTDKVQQNNEVLIKNTNAIKKFLENKAIKIEKFLTISAKEELAAQEILDTLQSIISELGADVLNSQDILTTRERQKEKLRNCITYLMRCDRNMDLEIVAQNIKAAANELSIVTGKIMLDDILDELFSRFCIGK